MPLVLSCFSGHKKRVIVHVAGYEIVQRSSLQVFFFLQQTSLFQQQAADRSLTENEVPPEAGTGLHVLH